VKSAVIGYILLILAGAVSFYLFLLADAVTIEEFIKKPAVEHMVHPTIVEIHVSVCGAATGIIVIVAFRRNMIAGPLIALILIPGAVMMEMALVAGKSDLIFQGLERIRLDILLIIG